MYKSLTAVALVCTLSPSPANSSSDLIAKHVAEELKDHNVETEILRVVDFNIKPGVQIDMGDGDDWPKLRQKIMNADILLIATPIWLGHASSVTQRVLERLDAELSETDDNGRLQTYGKVGVVAVVGNEDGAHKVTADVFQGLNDVGFSVPASGSTYWVGEAMQATDYNELSEVPEKTAAATKSLAANAAHLAQLLSAKQYPPVD